MTPVLAFDIETVPDVIGLRRLYALPESVPDAEVAEVAFQRRRARTGGDFLAPHMHRVVAISCVLREGAGLRIFTLGEPDNDEKTALQRFWDGVEKYTPQLVSWNGGGFDLPVMNYRSLMHGVTAVRYWDQGEDNRDFKWNNYVSRYHGRHLDLMDLLALYQPRNNAPLDEVAQFAGLPGKIGLEGGAVWTAWSEGRIADIRRYCEADTLNTYLLWLRFQKLRGALSAEAHATETELVRDMLARSREAHWQEFLGRWQAG